ncbi:MAG: hypothetical protein JST00_46625 [Deltaproteobacteria bacterium]|nr:hypothetical protein [Deltaproteobacteria bacterium]
MAETLQTLTVELPNGTSLLVSARGPSVQVHLEGNALVLSAPPGVDGAVAGEDDSTLELSIVHPIHVTSHVWVPQLTPEPGDVMGDRIFRAPAIILAGEGLALAIVVDVDDLHHAVSHRTWLDYDHPRRTLTFGAGDYAEKGHVFYERRASERPSEAAVLHRLHVLASTDPAHVANPYGMAARWMWDRWGAKGHAKSAPLPYAAYMAHIVRWAFSREEGWGESVWQEVPLEGDRPIAPAAPVFIVDVNRHPSVPPEKRTWREPRSIWNQAWFSTQRCANGLLRYARQVGSADLERRARAMTEIALAAPVDARGLFPSVLAANDDGTWRWTSSDRRPPTTSAEACHLVDAAFTCRMLLEWHGLTGDPRALAFVQRFAERLLLLQRPSGAFPGWIEPDGRICPELAEGPESAVAVALLFELAPVASGFGASFLEAATRGCTFLEGVVDDGRWEDFETYYSCARWGAPEQLGKRVVRNGVYKQNTLSIFWCAEAFRAAWRSTGERAYLARARRCLDELSLYQAVWSPPFIVVPAHGGFGVMNADSEWNDARQSLFAPLYLAMGQELGDVELLERGVSALRASFTMLNCPGNAIAEHYERKYPFFGPESYGFMMENQNHSGGEVVGTFTIFTWGNGSALSAVATVRDLFPDVALEHGLR